MDVSCMRLVAGVEIKYITIGINCRKTGTL